MVTDGGLDGTSAAGEDPLGIIKTGSWVIVIPSMPGLEEWEERKAGNVLQDCRSVCVTLLKNDGVDDDVEVHRRFETIKTKQPQERLSS